MLLISWFFPEFYLASRMGVCGRKETELNLRKYRMELERVCPQRRVHMCHTCKLGNCIFSFLSVYMCGSKCTVCLP